MSFAQRTNPECVARRQKGTLFVYLYYSRLGLSHFVRLMLLLIVLKCKPLDF